MAPRGYGTNSRGAGFTQAEIDAVWQKGKIAQGENAATRRKDICGAWIDKNQYGVTTALGTGWEIDHIVPVANGGTDSLANLQPLQWQNNRAKSDLGPGQWECAAFAK